LSRSNVLETKLGVPPFARNLNFFLFLPTTFCLDGTTLFTTKDGENTRTSGYPRINFVAFTWYLRVVGILIPIYKQVEYGYHIICTHEYPLPIKN